MRKLSVISGYLHPCLCSLRSTAGCSRESLRPEGHSYAFVHYGAREREFYSGYLGIFTKDAGEPQSIITDHSEVPKALQTYFCVYIPISSIMLTTEPFRGSWTSIIMCRDLVNTLVYISTPFEAKMGSSRP